MKTLRIRYFALLREQRGLATETLRTDAASLYAELQRAHGFTLPFDRLRAAVKANKKGHCLILDGQTKRQTKRDIA